MSHPMRTRHSGFAPGQAAGRQDYPQFGKHFSPLS